MKKISAIYFFLIFITHNLYAQILYTDFIPDKVDSVLQGNIDSVYFDADQDGTNDFTIICTSYWSGVSGFWSSIIEIDGLIPQNQIAVDLVNGSVANCGRIFLDSGICVGNNFSYETNAKFFRDGPPISCGPPSSTIKFYPFKLFKNNNTFFGWFRILTTGSKITVYDEAINQVPNDCLITGQTITNSQVLTHTNKIEITPNPNSGIFSCTLNKVIQKGKIDIFDMCGKNIYTIEINDKSSIEINSENLLNGVYIVKIFDQNVEYCSKIIINHQSK